MRTRKLGNSDLNLTTVGLGTWAIGGSWEYGWGFQDDKDSFSAISEAKQSGINWIDTAPIYGCGHSEDVIGYILKKLSWQPLVATKCGLLWDDQKRKLNCLKKDSIKRECENSLKRLRVEVIDLYQMHWPMPEEMIEEGWDAMAECVQEGKVRYLGCSNFSVEQMELVSKIHPITSIQPPYSMLNRGIENGITEYCKENNIGIVAYSPMQRGLLTGKVTKEWLDSLAPDDHRLRSPEFNEPHLSVNLKFVDALKEIATQVSCSLAQLAIAWVLRDEPVTAAIAGSRRAGQILETAPASDIDLSTGQIEAIEELLSQRDKEIGLG